jgi:hypothetical protein
MVVVDMVASLVFNVGGLITKQTNVLLLEDQYKALATIKIRETAEESWYSDTGTNQHMTSNTNEVQGINSYLGNNSFMVGNGHDLPITSTGHIIFLTTNLKLNDVHVVPAIKKKLPSVSQFTREK